MNLDAAIRLIKRTTPKNDPWTVADISEDAETATDVDDAIAAILNAVVAGALTTPTDARPDPVREAAEAVMPYLRWTIGPESPGHHPTMPSAVTRLERALAGGGQ